MSAYFIVLISGCVSCVTSSSELVRAKRKYARGSGASAVLSFLDITVDELSQSIKRLKRGKSPGIDGILADMIKDGGDLVQQCLLWLFNCLPATSLNVCLLG